jgi:hypothetical protein
VVNCLAGQRSAVLYWLRRTPDTPTIRVIYDNVSIILHPEVVGGWEVEGATPEVHSGT